MGSLATLDKPAQARSATEDRSTEIFMTAADLMYRTALCIAQRLRQMIQRHMHSIVATGGAITILTEEVGKLKAAQKRSIIQRKRRYLELVCSTLRELKESRRLRDLDITVAARNMFSPILGFARWYDPQGRFSSERICDEVTQFILAGLLRDPSRSRSDRRETGQ